jgi:carbon-monoxide dehydrogenase large subunit
VIETLSTPKLKKKTLSVSASAGDDRCLRPERRHISYSKDGQLLTGSLADYLVPTASDVPMIEVLHTETPSKLNELGLKGLGEGGSIPPAAVIANAICDALRPVGFELFATPIRNSDILKALLSPHRRTV